MLWGVEAAGAALLACSAMLRILSLHPLSLRCGRGRVRCSRLHPGATSWWLAGWLVGCRFGGAEALADDVQVASRLDSQKLYGHQERNAIGFVRENKNLRRTHAHLNSRLAAWQGQEKQLRIKS
jgi:hypothetical protein